MDQGGKIRTGNILRGMKGGAFEVTLASPAPPDVERFRPELDAASDRFVSPSTCSYCRANEQTSV